MKTRCRPSRDQSFSPLLSPVRSSSFRSFWPAAGGQEDVADAAFAGRERHLLAIRRPQPDAAAQQPVPAAAFEIDPPDALKLRVRLAARIGQHVPLVVGERRIVERRRRVDVGERGCPRGPPTSACRRSSRRRRSAGPPTTPRRRRRSGSPARPRARRRPPACRAASRTRRRIAAPSAPRRARRGCGPTPRRWRTPSACRTTASGAPPPSAPR